MAYSVLLLDGDEKLSVALAAALRREFEVERCGLAQRAFELLEKRRIDLLLVDPELPDMAPGAFLQALRQTESGKGLAVIVTSARKTEESVVSAFDLGVDDYVQKPADPRELLVRARAVLRRRYERIQHWGSALSLGGVELDPSQRLCVVQGARLRLQPREFELLEILMRKAGRVLTRPYLLETVWGMSGGAATRAVDVMISRVRRRLGKAGRRIETVSKLGYVFRAD